MKKVVLYEIFVMMVCIVMGCFRCCAATVREPRDPLPSIENELISEDDVTAGAPTDLISRQSVDSLRLISSLVDLSAFSAVKKPKDIAIDDSGNFVALVFQEKIGPGQNGGFLMIDVSNPFQPNVVGETAVDQPREVVITGDYAFTVGTTPFTSNGSLRIVDISNVTDPVLVGSRNPGSQIFSVDTDLVGDRTFCADTSTGVFMFDTTDKSNPVPLSVSSDAQGFGAAHVRLDKNRDILFVTDFFNQELKAFDTTSSPPLSLIGSISLPVPLNLVYLTLDVNNNFAFVGEFGGGGDTEIKMVDISDPVDMRLIDVININTVSNNAPSLQGIQVHDGVLYVSHAEGSGSSRAYISMLRYTPDGFTRVTPFFTNNIQDFPKVQIGEIGDGPIDGMALSGDFLYLPLLNASGQNGNFVIVKHINLLKFE